MKSKVIDFYWFSGTGNTLLVAREMRKYFMEQGLEVNLHRLEKSNPASIDPTHTIGLAFPVAVFSTYPFVWRFVEGLPQVRGTEVFMVATMAGHSGGLRGPMKKVLRAKGFKCLGAAQIKMPSNLLTVPKTEEIKQKIIAKGLKHARRYAHDLFYGVSSWTDIPVLSDAIGIMARSDKPWKSMQKSMALKVDTSRCINCGLCYKLCPADNIRMYEFPEFQDHCEICLRCINVCPVHAITSPKTFKSYLAVRGEEMLHPLGE